MRYPFVKKSISRYIYLAILLYCIYGFLMRLLYYPQSFYGQTDLGISWIIFFPFSFIILLYQTIFNNRIGWFIIAGCIFYTFILVIIDCINKVRYGDIVLATVAYIVIYLLFLMLYPRKNIPGKNRKKW